MTHRLIREMVQRLMDEENHQIETDLVEAVKTHGIGIEVVRQQSPEDLVHWYRGLRRDGVWLIDHHPEWGELHD